MGKVSDVNSSDDRIDSSDAGRAPVVTFDGGRTAVVSFGAVTALVEVFWDSVGVYVPRGADAPPSPVPDSDHFAALYRDDDGVVERCGTSLAVDADGVLRMVQVIDDAGFALAVAALDVFDADPGAGDWFRAVRRDALVEELAELERVAADEADEATRAAQRRDAAAVAVTALRARLDAVVSASPGC